MSPRVIRHYSNSNYIHNSITYNRNQTLNRCLTCTTLTITTKILTRNRCSSSINPQIQCSVINQLLTISNICRCCKQILISKILNSNIRFLLIHCHKGNQFKHQFYHCLSQNSKNFTNKRRIKYGL